MRRFLFYVLVSCIFAGIGYAGLMLYTHTDPFTTSPWQQQNVPAAAQRP
jgi:hypothetical protein